MSKIVKKLSIWLLVMLMTFGGFAMVVNAASVVPVGVEMNDPDIPGFVQINQFQGQPINSTGTYTIGALTVTVTFNETGQFIDRWESNIPISYVFVKGGQGGGGNLYHYEPAVFSDSNLKAKDNNNGPAEISHVTFYYAEPVNLTLKKELLASDGVTDVSSDATKFTINILCNSNIVGSYNLANGEQASVQLVPWEYTIQEEEMQAPYSLKNIFLDDTQISGSVFTLGEAGATVTVQNEKAIAQQPTGSITIKKVVQEYTEAKSWINVEDNTSFFVNVYSAGEDALMNAAPIEIKANAEGEGLISGLPYGTYNIKEIIPNPGYTQYDADDDDYFDTVTLDSENQTQEAVIVNRKELPDEEPLKNGSVKVIKTIGSTGIPQKGVKFKLYDSSKDVPELITDANGEVLFQAVPIGTYTLEEVKPECFDTYMSIEASPALLTAEVAAEDSIQVTVEDEETTIVDVTNKPIINKGEAYEPELKIEGYKFNDLNKNEVRDEDEPGLANWTIELYKDYSEIDINQVLVLEEQEPIATAITDENGYYKFTELQPGGYIVKEVQQSGWQCSTDMEKHVYLQGSWEEDNITVKNLLDDSSFKNALPNENTLFEAEGRIGRIGDYELAVKTLNPTNVVQVSRDKDEWLNFAEPQDFSLSYDSSSGLVTFQTMDEVLQYTLNEYEYVNDIMIRTRAAKEDSGILITNIMLNKAPVNGTSVAVNDTRDTDILWIGNINSNGFTLTGESMMYWDNDNKPKNSELAYQIAVGTAIVSDTEAVDFGNYQLDNEEPDEPDEPEDPEDPEEPEKPNKPAVPVTNPGKPDLVVTKTDNGSIVSPGGLVEYTIIVENKGSSYAQDVKLYETLPEGAVFVSDRNPDWTLEEGKYVYNFGNLNVGENREAKFIVMVDNPFPKGLSKILNNVEVKDNGTETATIDNIAYDDTPVLTVETIVIESPETSETSETSETPETPETPHTPVIEGETQLPDLPFTGGMAEAELLFAGLGVFLMGAGLVLKRK